jgi:hypothetical protein
MLQLRIESGDFYFYFLEKTFQIFPIQKTQKFRQFEKNNSPFDKKILNLKLQINF